MRAASAMLVLLGMLASTGSVAGDRSIGVNPSVSQAWAFSTGGPKVISGPAHGHALGVGFWQRASGAKPGVGENFISSLEFQLPEAAPSRIRSASVQFSGRASQCSGNEPVVIDVYVYAGDGKSAIADSAAGTRVAQMSADCNDRQAFNRPIDVTAMVRQQSVPSGVRYVGINVRKANNRQLPSLFDLTGVKLTVVVSDQDIARSRTTASPAGAATPPTTPSPTVAVAAPARRAPAAAPAPSPAKATTHAAQPAAAAQQTTRK